MDKTCPTHKLNLKFVSEGVSKKGTRYAAFFACPNRDCKYTENIEEKQGHFLSMQAEFRRSREIAFFNSVNAAIEIVKGEEIMAFSAGMHDQTKGIVGTREGNIRQWRDWFLAEWKEWYIKNILNEEE